MITFLFSLILIPIPAYFWSMNNFFIASTSITTPHRATIQLGIQTGLEECQKQFKDSLWNCPSSEFNKNAHPSKRNRLKVTRETAFLQAIINAAIVHKIATSCQRSHQNNCTCRHQDIMTSQLNQHNQTQNLINQTNPNWAGCEDAVKSAMKVASDFWDRTQSTDTLASINTHNSLVGRQMVQKTMKKECRCHGLSGSCNLKTCWYKVVDFHKIGQELKLAYKRAKKFEINNMLKTNDETTSNNLIYVEDSPNYCYPNDSYGSVGTLGRQCESKSVCDELCTKCGYNITEKLDKSMNKCNCKFHWCCHVECEICPPKKISVCSSRDENK